MMNVDKQIEEVMGLVQDLMNAQSSSQRIREKKTLKSKLRTLLSSAQSWEQAKPVWVHVEAQDPDYSRFFPAQDLRDAEEFASSHNGEVTKLYTHPAPAMEVKLHPNEVIALANLTGVNVYGPDDYPDQEVIAKLIAFVKVASQPNGEA